MSNANDQTPFGSSIPSHDSVSDKLHLARSRRLLYAFSTFFFIDLYALNKTCLQVDHCIGKFNPLWINFGERKLETTWGVK